MKINVMSRKSLAGIAIFTVLFAPLSVSASFFDELLASPSIVNGVGGNINYEFDDMDNAGMLVVTSMPSTLNVNGSSPHIQNGTFSMGGSPITAGVLQTAGKFIVQGAVAAMGITDVTTTLLQGAVNALMADVTNGIAEFDFLTTITGGALAAYFPSQGGILVTATDTGFSGDWTVNFGGAATVSVGVPVPEPSTLLLTALGLLGLLSLGRRRTR